MIFIIKLDRAQLRLSYNLLIYKSYLFNFLTFSSLLFAKNIDPIAIP